MASMTTLDSGARVLVEGVPSVATSIGIWFSVSPRDEGYGTRGAAHLLEHAVMRGSHTMSADEIAARLSVLGDNNNAETEREHTAYWCRVPSHDYAEALGILLDTTLNARLSDEDIEVERRSVMDEIDMYDQDQEWRAFDMLMERVHSNTPLGRSIGGTREEVQLLTPEIVRAFYEKHYTTDRMTVAVVGDVDENLVVSMVDQAIKQSGRGTGVATTTSWHRSFPSDYIDLDGDGRCYMYHGIPGVQYGHDLYYPAVILSTVLGDGNNSRVHRIVRGSLGLVYDASSAHYAFTDAGLLALTVTADDADNARRVMDIMHNEFTDLTGPLVGDDELERAKRSVANDLILDADGTYQLMRRLGFCASVVGWTEPVSINETVERIMAVNAGQVRDVARLIDDNSWSRVEFTA